MSGSRALAVASLPRRRYPPAGSKPGVRELSAQATRDGGRGPQGPYARTFDAATLETLSGDVERVEDVTSMGGMSTGVHVILRDAAGETIPVHLGPAWFLDTQELSFQPGDTLEVTGSRVTLDGNPALIASKVVKDGKELILRDAAGIPVWSAARFQRRR